MLVFQRLITSMIAPRCPYPIPSRSRKRASLPHRPLRSRARRAHSHTHTHAHHSSVTVRGQRACSSRLRRMFLGAKPQADWTLPLVTQTSLPHTVPVILGAIHHILAAAVSKYILFLALCDLQGEETRSAATRPKLWFVPIDPFHPVPLWVNCDPPPVSYAASFSHPQFPGPAFLYATQPSPTRRSLYNPEGNPYPKRVTD
ncbi:hypothetical protein LY78DRAFT_222397 [Colletotrichum sublineola]|nr:hypothetical protein LY78DRAFT_222397 [Colletotrichum sublineola]